MPVKNVAQIKMEDWKYQQPPQPTINGGWYTGEPFPTSAPWRNFEVTPDVSFMIHRNLSSANPPPGAIFQYPGSYRPGNNAQSMPGVTPSGGAMDIMCTRSTPKSSVVRAPPPKFSRYAYW